MIAITCFAGCADVDANVKTGTVGGADSADLSDGSPHDSIANPADSSLADAAPIDVKHDGVTDVSGRTADADVEGGPEDVGVAKPEQCGNFKDDDLDGLIDEGCVVSPNISDGKLWSDFGLFEVAPGAIAGPKRKVALTKGRRMVVVARSVALPPAPDAEVLIIPDWIKGPQQVVWLGGGAWSSALGRAFGDLRLGTVLLGNTDASKDVVGVWELGFRPTTSLSVAGPGAPQDGWLHIGAVHAVATPEKMALDMDVYIVGGQPMPIEAFEKSTFWSKVRARCDQIWSPAGLSIGAVSLQAIDGDNGDKYRHVDDIDSAGPNNELRGLFGLAGELRPKSARVSVFLVSTLNALGQPAAKGVTGQIAGVPGLAGHFGNGIAVAMNAEDVSAAMKGDASGTKAGNEYGRTLAHEIGHYLGLWHTTEVNGKLHDTVTDTDTCKLKAGEAIIDPDACPGAAKNVMFPVSMASALSSGQAVVARRHPWPH